MKEKLQHCKEKLDLILDKYPNAFLEEDYVFDDEAELKYLHLSLESGQFIACDAVEFSNKKAAILNTKQYGVDWVVLLTFFRKFEPEIYQKILQTVIDFSEIQIKEQEFLDTKDYCGDQKFDSTLTQRQDQMFQELVKAEAVSAS